MLKPQDIFALVALASRDDQDWTYERLGDELELSPSQLFQSLERAEASRLFVKENRHIIRRNLLEFLVHGVRYAFPATPGRIARGVPAGWQAPGLSALVSDSSETFVWSSANGTVRGQSVAPLHTSVPSVVQRDPKLHAWLALIDIVRVGSARERNVAASELEARLE